MRMMRRSGALFATNNLSPHHAQRYLKALSSSALLYSPARLRPLTEEQNLSDRVVQTFFDTTVNSIRVFQAEDRLSQVSSSTPSHSFYQLRLPFGSNLQLRKKMEQSQSSHIRIGRVLELMDYIAANVSYRYCIPKEERCSSMDSLPFVSVTACIDEIDFYREIDSRRDCIFNGYVSFVGKSSMEVHIDVMQEAERGIQLACSAKFVMAARDKITRKAYSVPPLHFDGEGELFKIVNQLGDQRQKRRKSESSRSLEVSPPTYQESAQIHRFHREGSGGSGGSGGSERVSTPMSATTTTSSMLMHVEDRNLSNKIFGGFILRLAYELGWLCAYRFLKVTPKVVYIDDVQFIAPVEIGSYVQFESKVCYVNEEYLHVIITCRNCKFTGEQIVTNVVRVTFEHPKGTQAQIVYPQTVAESYSYIQAMRTVKEIMK